MNFCDYETGYAGKCGIFTLKTRCERHIDLKQKEKRVKGLNFSGDSKHRQEMGQFQAKVKR